jgi:hypothetical protein
VTFPELSGALRRAEQAVRQAERNLEEARRVLAAAKVASEAGRRLLRSLPVKAQANNEKEAPQP